MRVLQRVQRFPAKPSQETQSPVGKYWTKLDLVKPKHTSTHLCALQIHAMTANSAQILTVMPICKVQDISRGHVLGLKSWSTTSQVIIMSRSPKETECDSKDTRLRSTYRIPTSPKMIKH